MTDGNWRARVSRLFTGLVDGVASIWFGLATIVAILVYCWLGSAGTQPFWDWFPRQTFEKTEMEWFAWWPLQVLVGLLALSLILVTWRRIRWSLENLGVLMVHLGILVLLLGAVIYFSLKIEGDVAVYRRAAVITVGEGEPVRLVLRPRSRAVVRGESSGYHVRVVSLDPGYELLTGKDKGQKTFAVQLRFDPLKRGEQQPFIRQLLVGYPEYVEDVIPKKGRAIKVLGKRLIDPDLQVRLEYAETNKLYLHDRPALYARRSGDDDWVEMPIPGLPHYRGYVRDLESIFPPEGEGGPRIKPLAIELRPEKSHAPLAGDLSLSVTGFLPFARMKRESLPKDASGKRKRSRTKKPAIIPAAERDLRAGPTRSMIEVEVRSGDEIRRQWVEYSHYPHPSRAGFFRRSVRLPQGGHLELVYSRETVLLPSAVALEDFRLETYPGGSRERDFISLVRFRENEQWSEVEEVRSNQPTERDGWWYFQSTWDPPVASQGYQGLNHTGLGVGNRHGVWVMLFGCILTVFGSVWAFYVKPWLLRRSRSAAARSLAALCVMAVCLPAVAGEEFYPSVGSQFRQDLDLSAFRRVAVQEQGRVKTFDSLAREKLKHINPKLLKTTDPALLYLDMLLVPEHYAQADFIRIKHTLIRRRLVQALRSEVPAEKRRGAVSEEELTRIFEGGNVSPAFLDHSASRKVLSELERDLRRSGKAAQHLRRARNLARTAVLRSLLKAIPPPGGEKLDPWYNLHAAVSARGVAPRDHIHAGMGISGVPGLSEQHRSALADSWQALERAWRFQDAAGATGALESLAQQLARIEPGLYPDQGRLGLELWYYKHNKLTGGWLIYFLALPFLLMAFVYQLKWARWAGLGLFGAGFLVHTFSLAVRWWLAARIPNANMFEAIIASAWFGGACAIALEALFRGKRLRMLPAICASAYAALAMMFGNFMVVNLNSDITTVMPVLDRTIWLYIHTNVVIASYALIAFGAIAACGTLLARLLARLFPARFGEMFRPTIYARGGAGSVILDSTPGGDQGLARTLDGATMVFMEMAFVSLWVGTILGAVWADVSWGRPWGWDPKEVFALNTWLVFLVLLHLRMKVRDKAFWTAVLAVAGFVVMLFNWIAVNFVIVGLHSYA